MLIPGDILIKRYEILKLLGRGGMSQVYLARDLRLQEKWVIKELNLSGYPEEQKEQLRKQFQVEAQILAHLSHPILPKGIDYFSDRGNTYLVEEYIEGTILREIIEEGISEEELIDFALQLCSVLKFIHKEKIIYRDLKPSNIIVTPEKKLKLIDFGIARFYKDGQKRDTIFSGTPGYASPEQYGFAQTDKRSDIYSLGACLYFMATKVDPPAENFDPSCLRKLNPHISPALEKIILKAMEIDPENRFQDVSQIEDSLLSIKSPQNAYHKPGSEQAFQAPLLLKSKLKVTSYLLLLFFIFVFIFLATKIKLPLRFLLISTLLLYINIKLLRIGGKG